MIGIHSIKPGSYSGNVYLINQDNNYILIDTGLRSKRNLIEKKLLEYGCFQGRLKCILLTHGDFDHCGNAIYLSKKYICPIGIHKNDSMVVESGDMFINRKKSNAIIRFLVKHMIGIEKFKPDIYLEDNGSLKSFGLDAFVVHTPGHSPGSISIITYEGECFCGDLFENTKTPKINSIFDDYEEMIHSISRLKDYKINVLYPGHGDPFPYIKLENNIGKEPDVM
jgi:glyoxylase-like metal-dependent hydrolase (beta-lactamase superfamily II)